MKVTATGVSEATGREMFAVWVNALGNYKEDVGELEVHFVLEEENART